MYFQSRREAGKLLAQELANYRYENTAILALSDGGVPVAEEIALALHTTIQLLLTEPLTLQDLGGETIGVIDQTGQFTYNDMVPAGLLEEMMIENRTVVEEQKLQKLSKINKLLGEYGVVDRQMFYGRNVIIVSDGLKSGMSFAAAVNYLKPINTKKIIAAVPMVSVAAVDRLHILADELHILDVKGNYLDTDHYYEQNDIGDAQEIIKVINSVVSKWA